MDDPLCLVCHSWHKFAVCFCAGDASLDENGGSRMQMAKTEISLTLSNKFELPDDERSDLKNMLIRYKAITIVMAMISIV